MRILEDELFPSTPGKVKIERAHAINRQFYRCFASTSTMFLWALFLIALTASYLSFQSLVDTSSKSLLPSWGGLHWEMQISVSADVRRPHGISVLVTGAASFVGSHVSIALHKRGDGVVGLDNFKSHKLIHGSSSPALSSVFCLRDSGFFTALGFAERSGIPMPPPRSSPRPYLDLGLGFLLTHRDLEVLHLPLPPPPPPPSSLALSASMP